LGYAATSDVFSYTVPPINHAPVAVNDSAATQQNQSARIEVLANDSDPDGDPLAVSAVTQGTHGTVTRNSDDTLTYAPEEDYFGTDSFTYTISDGRGRTALATVSVTVEFVDHAPVAVNDSAATLQNKTLKIKVLANDSDPDGDRLAVSGVAQARHGVTRRNSDNTVTYVPAHNYFGTDSFTYTISDGRGGTALSAATPGKKARIADQAIRVYDL
jgi:hypothetical protein